MQKKLTYLQIDKNNAKHFEIAKSLWLPFICEVNEHDGITETEEEIINSLRKRISIQGSRPDMHFEIALLKNEPVGIAMFAIDTGTVYGLLEAGYGTMMGFFIRPEHRCKGYGIRRMYNRRRNEANGIYVHKKYYIKLQNRLQNFKSASDFLFQSPNEIPISRAATTTLSSKETNFVFIVTSDSLFSPISVPILATVYPYFSSSISLAALAPNLVARIRS